MVALHNFGRLLIESSDSGGLVSGYNYLVWSDKIIGSLLSASNAITLAKIEQKYLQLRPIASCQNHYEYSNLRLLENYSHGRTHFPSITKLAHLSLMETFHLKVRETFKTKSLSQQYVERMGSE